MTAKEFMRQYGDCEQRIYSKARRIRQLREQAVSLSQSLGERVQGTRPVQRQSVIVECYVDMERELAEEVARLKETQRQVTGMIARLADGREQNVLDRYYIEGMTLEKTAEDLHYSYMQVCRIHGKALEHVERELGVG